MRKARATSFDYGYIPDGRYFSGVSGGSHNTFCSTLQRCKTEWSELASAYGVANSNAQMHSEVVGTERIVYEQNGRNKFNACDHWKVGGFNYPISGIFTDFVKASQYLSGRRLQGGDYVSTVDRHPLFDFSAAQRTAWHTMQPEFEGNVAMLNFIYELKDFKSIAKLIAQKPLDKLARAFKKWRNNKKDLVYWDPSLPIASGHLANEYALKPLISDIIAIHQQLGEIVRGAQVQFALDGLQDNTRYYSEAFSNTDATISLPFCSGLLDQTTFTACMQYSYKYSMRSDFDALLRYWGLDLNAEVVWNAIPFSFLADYFMNIGETIALLDHDPNVDLTFSFYSESLKTIRMSGDFFDGANGGDWQLINNQSPGQGYTPIMGNMSSLYSRYAALPNKGTVLPTFSMPSTGQWTNIAALVRCIL